MTQGALLSSSNFFKNRAINRRSQLAFWKGNWRTGLLRFIERLLLGANVSDRLSADLTQHLQLPEIANQVISHRVISDGMVLDPVTIEPINLESADVTLTATVCSMYEIVLKNASSDIITGLVRLNYGFIIESSLFHWQQLLYRGGVGNSYYELGSPGERLEGSWAILPVSEYFYHTLIEELPRLLRLRKNGHFDGVIVHSTTRPWALELLRESEFHVLVVQDHKLLIEELRITTSPRSISSAEVGLLREAFSVSSLKDEMSLFISRGNLARGDLELEEEIFTMLKEFGFKKINPSELSIRRQIEVFSSAKHIVGLHGGALSNIVWARPGTLILEIFNHPYRNYCFARLAHEANLRYSCIEMTPDKNACLNALLSFIDQN